MLLERLDSIGAVFARLARQRHQVHGQWIHSLEPICLSKDSLLYSDVVRMKVGKGKGLDYTFAKHAGMTSFEIFGSCDGEMS